MSEAVKCERWRPLAMKGICECGARFYRHSREAQDNGGDHTHEWVLIEDNGAVFVIDTMPQLYPWRCRRCPATKTDSMPSEE